MVCTFDNPATMARECWQDSKLVCAYDHTLFFLKDAEIPGRKLFFGANIGPWQKGQIVGDKAAIGKEGNMAKHGEGESKGRGEKDGQGGTSKLVNCQLPGADLVAGGKSIEEAIANTEKKRGVGRPPKFDTPQDMQAVIDDYFESCWQIVEVSKGEGENRTTETKRVQHRPYTVMGLALALDLSRQGLCEYAEKGQFSDIVKRAKQTVELSVEEQLIAGKNATGPIFWLKNHAGYTDKITQELTGPEGRNLSLEVVFGKD